MVEPPLGVTKELKECLYYFCWRRTVGQTFFGSSTVRTVGVWCTFSLLLWNFRWTYWFWLPNIKNCWALEPLLLDLQFQANNTLSSSNKWLKSQINTNSFQLLGVQNYCIKHFSPTKKCFLGAQTPLNGQWPNQWRTWMKWVWISFGYEFTISIETRFLYTQTLVDTT